MREYLGAGVILIAMLTCSSISSVCADPEKFLEEFKDPPAWYHSAPLWVWNDDITEEHIEHQLEMLRSQEVLQAFVHPRPGLMTPYLSDRWLDLYEFAVKTAKGKGMLLHIYDENSYPSGFAGGHVYDRHPEWGGKGIEMEEVDKIPGPKSEDVLAVYEKEEDSYSRITEPIPGESGEFVLIRIVQAEPRAWTAGGPYADILQPGLTEEFLRITYEPYRERFGEEFGKTVRGAFTDEPHPVPAGQLHWTPGLLGLFEKRYGYSLLDTFPSLYFDRGDYRKVRFDFYRLLLDELIERWSKPYFDYCEKHGLLATGHFWEHEWPRSTRHPDNMALYAFQQMPAIDCLMNRYSEDPHAQFGNVRAVKELSSIANQLALPRRLCEVYGAGGWEMTFSDQKRIADWLGVLGVNLFNQHLTYMTLRGARKRDHPLSFSDHEPWWEHYHVLGKYIARLSYALSQGEERSRILVLEPTTSAWLLERAAGPRDELEAMGASFQAFITDLSLNQVEYDLASERTLRDHGKVEGEQFRVGKRDYDILVLHKTCANLTRSTFDRIETLLQSGGRALCVGGTPSFIDGLGSDEVKRVFPSEVDPETNRLLGGSQEESEELEASDTLSDYLADRYSSAKFSNHEGGKLFHQFRRLDGEGILFLSNTSAEENASGAWTARGGGVKVLDLVTGEEAAASFDRMGEEVTVEFDLPPAGSALYRISKEKTSPVAVQEKEYKPVPLTLNGIERLGPNVLPVDYVDYEVADKKEENIFFFEAQTAIYQAHGFEGNPWDRAVQFKDQILKRDEDFVPSTGFSVTYRFPVEGFNIAPSLSVTLEQADRYLISFNGEPSTQPASPTNDPAFDVLSFENGARVGANELQLQASPFSVHHEVEPIYVQGEFRVEPRGKGFTILPPADLTYGSWREQGLPFYSDAVRYEYTFETQKNDNVYKLKLGDWSGVVAAVSVDGNPVGILGWRPFEIDLPKLAPGSHKIAVDVYGSLKNLYGPHHGNPELGAAWPSGFLKAPKEGPPPGSEYHVLDYGLSEAPTLEAD
jgi:hypothetical protein